ncbi:nucleic acid binding protein [Ligustrum virus A]|uniref:RNA silencing suppressor n=1 Tax=Ligustrum virus A TaxID=1899566 RepID=A0A1C9IAX2_9VIRU|nr:nucleic acid binding protein [Ligustrum virus A]AOO96604.1 nucleic acid binding protein [Ligustrum virus A]
MNSHKKDIVFLLLSVFKKRGGSFPLAICVLIYQLAFNKQVGGGTSTYARRRRAVSIGRCHRCYRVYPPPYFGTKCDNKTCAPGLSYNVKVENFIRWGVTEVIPQRAKNKTSEVFRIKPN